MEHEHVESIYIEKHKQFVRDSINVSAMTVMTNSVVAETDTDDDDAQAQMLGNRIAIAALHQRGRIHSNN
jgi:hypothetical protein